MIKHFFDTLQIEMEKKGWDLQKLTDEAGLNKVDLAYTIGAPYLPRFDEVVKIADALGVSLDIFRKGDTE